MLDFANTNIRMELDDIQRRLFSLIQIGTVNLVDHDQARLRVEIDTVITAWLPWLTYRAGKDKTWWAPEPGEQVLVLSMAGELNNGVVLPAIYQNSFSPTNKDPNVHHVEYEDGTSIKYDRAAHTLTIDIQGGDVTVNTTANLNATAGGNAEITATDATINASGDANVTAGGDVNVNGTNINLNGGTSGGVVCQTHVCAFTGSPHPQGSITVKGGG